MTLVRMIWMMAAVLASLAPAPSLAQTRDAPATTTLQVGTRIVPPFVFRDDGGQLVGFSIDLWAAIAKEIRVDSDFVVAKDVGDLLAGVSSGANALGISAISITSEREKTFDFSQPMFDGGLQIAVATRSVREASPAAGFFSFVFSLGFLEVLAAIFVLMLLPAPFIWLAERNSGEDLLDAKTRFGQFGQAIWWSICALGGQAQDMPSRTIGRLIAVPWMMFAVLFSSYFTAAVTTRMTVKQLERAIEGPEDLAGHDVVTVANTTAAAWLRSRKLATQEVADIDTAMQAVKSGRAEAVVYDEPVLAYLASHSEKGRVKTVGPVFQRQNYGLIFLPGDPRRRAINEVLLRLRENGEYQRIYQRWFGGIEE